MIINDIWTELAVFWTCIKKNLKNRPSYLLCYTDKKLLIDW